MKTDDLCLSALSGAERHRHPRDTAIPHGLTKDAYLCVVNNKDTTFSPPGARGRRGIGKKFRTPERTVGAEFPSVLF